MKKKQYLSEVRPIYFIGGDILDVDAIYNKNKEENARHINIAQNLIQEPNILNVAKAAYHAYRGIDLGLPFSGKPEQYNPTNTGIAPLPTKAINASEALAMIRAMKAKKAAEIAAKNVIKSKSRSLAASYANKTPEQIKAMSVARVAAGKKSAEIRRSMEQSEAYIHRFDAAREANFKKEIQLGMRRSLKDAEVLSGKTKSAFRRKSNGSAYNWGAITVDDIYK